MHTHTYINILQFGKSSSLYFNFIKVGVELATTNILKTKQVREKGRKGGGGEGEHIYKSGMWVFFPPSHYSILLSLLRQHSFFLSLCQLLGSSLSLSFFLIIIIISHSKLSLFPPPHLISALLFPPLLCLTSSAALSLSCIFFFFLIKSDNLLFLTVSLLFLGIRML